MAEEPGRTTGSPEAPAQKAAASPPPSQDAGVDIPGLLQNIGLLIESTIDSVTGMLASATSVTRQTVENIGVTMNSDTVQEVVKTIGKTSENVVGNVNAALSSRELNNAISEIGNLAENLVKTVESVATSEQTQNLFNTIATGLNQLAATVVSPVQAITHKADHKKPVEIPFCHKTPSEPEKPATPEKKETATEKPLQKPVGEAAEPVKPVEPAKPAEPTKPPQATKPAEPVKPAQAGGISGGSTPGAPGRGSSAEKKQENDKANVKPRSAGTTPPQGGRKNDPSRKGTYPRKKTD